MTHPLSSSTESEALRIGDPVPPVILNRKRSASDWGSSPDWIPVFTGMTEGRCGNDGRDENDNG